MLYKGETKTIIAESSPPGSGGVSLLRLSGLNSLLYLSKTTKTKRSFFKNRTVFYKSIWDNKGNLVDQVLVVYFKKPNSYTGEDVVEVSCHGSPLIVAKVLAVFIKLGASLADPGEFTKRAFLNGKLTLLQAEAVGEIISAKTKQAALLNVKLLKENNQEELEDIKNSLVLCASKIEHLLDISDEDYEADFHLSLIESLSYTAQKLKAYKTNYKENKKNYTPQRVVFHGKPNVGKSTLFNALLGKDRAITNKEAGTTRDIIEAESTIGSHLVTLVDTAGTRKSKDPVETEGMRRTENEVSKADVLLRVSEGVENIELRKHEVLVLNKSDIINYEKDYLNKNSCFVVSAKKGYGLELLKAWLFSKLTDKKGETAGQIITTSRQFQAIKKALFFLEKALAILETKNPELELVAFELKESIGSFSALLGVTETDDIMETVFKNFCVGK